MIHYGTIISIILRIISSIIMLFFFIPLQVKEVLVKNGLRRLRIQLLSVGIIVLASNILTAYILIDLLTSYSKQRFDDVLAQLLNAIAYLALSIIYYRMYKAQYSPESKRLHEKIGKLETTSKV